MSDRAPMTEPGYDAEGRWHGPATAEVNYWKARALKAELNKETPVTCGTTKVPPGWRCTRDRGHPGPCAAHELVTHRG